MTERPTESRTGVTKELACLNIPHRNEKHKVIQATKNHQENGATLMSSTIEQADEQTNYPNIQLRF